MTQSTQAAAAALSPCVQVCAVDTASGLCLGCLRSLPEIARWGRMSERERVSVLADLPARRGRLPPALR